jgi:hypothetical protein
MLRDIYRPLTTQAEPKPETQSSGNSGKTTPTNPTAKITVVLADDHNIVREGLRLLIESAPDVEVVAEAENGRQAVQKVLELRPHIAI